MKRKSPLMVLPLALAVISACEQRAPMVYVLESPQTVTLTASATPTSARPGDTVVLRAARRVSGEWKQIPRDQLQAGQCWVYRPPAQTEEQVAADIHWQAVPENAVQFEREYRMDRGKNATMLAQGTIKLTPISPVPCEEDRVVEGEPVYIEVS